LSQVLIKFKHLVIFK